MSENRALHASSNVAQSLCWWCSLVSDGRGATKHHPSIPPEHFQKLKDVLRQPATDSWQTAQRKFLITGMVLLFLFMLCVQPLSRCILRLIDLMQAWRQPAEEVKNSQISPEVILLTRLTVMETVSSCSIVTRMGPRLSRVVCT